MAARSCAPHVRSLRTVLCSRFGLALVLAISLFPLLPSSVYAAGVVGTGTPESCTQAALATALTGGGTITFNCGPNPVTITISTTLNAGGTDTTIDGGGRITLQGQNTRILLFASAVERVTTLTVKNITLTKGRVSGSPDAAPGGIGAADPNGAAIYSYNNGDLSYPPVLNLNNVQFIDNDASMTRYEDAHGGGAIFMRDGFVNVTNSTFNGNDCTNCTGGAIQLMGATLKIEGSTFINNTATNSPGGGAIYQDSGWRNDWSGDASITNSTFRNNRAQGSGGAILFIPYRATNEISIDRSAFVDNASDGGSTGQGGAIFAYTSRSGISDDPGDGLIDIHGSLFTGNYAKSAGGIGLGGALWLVNTTVRVTNSTIVKNTAYGDTDWNPKGGGMYLGSPRTRAEITNSTVAYNHAGGTGGGISIMNGNGQLRNTIVAHNTVNNAGQTTKFALNCNEELVDGGNNLEYPPRGTRSEDRTCLKGKSGLNQRTLPDFRDPLLKPLADNGGPTQTMAIGTDSPAHNGGNSATCPGLDQRGYKRNGVCDIGAYEAGGTPFVPSVRVYLPLTRK